MALNNDNISLSTKAVYDINLINKAVSNGDEAAYAELMSRYREAVYFMLLKMVNNKHDAEDLTIEAFGKAFMKLPNYTASYSFSTWLFKIATNNCIDFIRRKKMGNFSIDKPLSGSESDSSSFELKALTDNPEDSVIKKQKSLIIKTWIGNLKPSYRELIELRYFQELSYEEIVDKTGLPLGTVKAQLYRAKELLTEIMKSNLDY